jgi:formylglycine-generating enzyme required for sulfatase activity
MHGNVLEWCQDWLGTYAGGIVVDPQGPESSTHRVRRSGSAFGSGLICRAANRGGLSPDRGLRDTGLRFVLTPGQP